MSEKFLVIAHRGASAYEPENTLRAVRRALEMGADMVEFDVRASRDGRLVVLHDPTVDRTTDGSGLVSELTFEELRSLDAGRGEKIPTLEEVIEFMGMEAGLVVELKVPGVEERVVRALREYQFVGRAIVTSFSLPIVRHVKALFPDVKTGVQFAAHHVNTVRLALDAGADYILPQYSSVDGALVEQSHRHGLPVFPWAIDDVDDGISALRLGVDGIITKKPDIIKSATREFTSASF